MISNDVLKCEDCGLPYKDFPLDANIPNSQWLAIHPSGQGGVLCPNCMCARANNLGATCAWMVFDHLNLLPAENANAKLDLINGDSTI